MVLLNTERPYYFFALALFFVSGLHFSINRYQATLCPTDKATFQRVNENDAYKMAVYPRLQGGLGNQMFILAAALIVASETNRTVLVNSKQTAVHSFGVPQPVFWHTVFHSIFFVKHEAYSEIGSDIMDEDAFDRALRDEFQGWKRDCSILLSGPFIRFDTNVRYHSLLLQAFEPTGEVQRWVNDAAIKLRLAPRSADMPSSLAATEIDGNTALEKLTDNPEIINGVGWCTTDDPRDCEKRITYMSCDSQFCGNNIALHLRLHDSSSSIDYWTARELKAVKTYLLLAVEEERKIRIVIFSNDIRRARVLMESGDQRLSSHLTYSDYLDVVEFLLMSQYFGTHILTPKGSTFQMWALFLSQLGKVKVLTLPGESPHVKDLSSLPHIELEKIMIAADVE